MMRVQELLHLPVYTKSGNHLGRVVDAVCDPDDLRIMQLVVKSGVALPLVSKEHIIHREQVISVTPEKVVVEDAVLKSAELAASAKPV